jgi:hypothetical protein
MRVNDGKLHYSHLKKIDQSAMHLLRDEDSEDSDTFAIGRAFHQIVLQGITPKHWTGKRSGKEYESAVERNNKEIIITQTAYDEVMRMAEACDKSRLVQDLLRRCPNRETYMTWERNNEECAGTIDAHGPEALVELKSCESAQPYRFRKQAGWYRYPEQMAWYNVALGGNFGEDPKLFDSYVIACEKKAPYAISCHIVKPIRLIQANARCEDWISKYQACKRDGFWPGWDTSVWEIDFEMNDKSGDDDA